MQNYSIPHLRSRRTPNTNPIMNDTTPLNHVGLRIRQSKLLGRYNISSPSHNCRIGPLTPLGTRSACKVQPSHICLGTLIAEPCRTCSSLRCLNGLIVNSVSFRKGRRNRLCKVEGRGKALEETYGNGTLYISPSFFPYALRGEGMEFSTKRGNLAFRGGDDQTHRPTNTEKWHTGP